jgi:hypothetical protein
VVQDLGAGPAVSVREPSLRDRDAFGSGDALPEWVGCGFDRGDRMILGVSWSTTIRLPTVPISSRVTEGRPNASYLGIHRLRFRQMRHEPQKHRGRGPLERLDQIGLCGSKCMTRFHVVYTNGANAIGVLG